MRTMFNPSRMAVIKAATQKLVDKIKSLCPKCKTPGFGVTDTKTGLPCDLCGMPTASIKRLVYQCKKCTYVIEKTPPDGRLTEDPTYCDFCNP